MATIANSRQLQRLSVLAACMIAMTGCQPPGPKALLEGERLMGEGKYQEAISQLATAVELLPQNAQAWNHLGLALHRSGHAEEALKAYQKSVQLDRNLAPARFNLGMLHHEQGRYGEAANELTTYTALQPGEQAAWVRLADSLYRAKRFDEAERAYVSAYRLNQTDPETLNGLGLMQLQKRRVRDAQAWFLAALKADPSFPPALFNMAVLHHHYIVNKPLALQRYKEYTAIQPPAENAALAAELARQLEAELTPRQATNTASMTVTNVALARPTILTNSPAPAPAQATNLVATKVPTNTLATTHPAVTNAAPSPKPATNTPPVVTAPAKPAIAHAATNALVEKMVEKAVTPPTAKPPAEKPVEKLMEKAVASQTPTNRPPEKVLEKVVVAPPAAVPPPTKVVEKTVEKPAPTTIAAATNEAPKPAKPAQKPAEPAPEVQTAKLEVVRVEEDAPIAPVKDIATEPARKTAPAKIVEPPAPAPATTASLQTQAPQPVPAETNPPIVRRILPKEKKSIWAKANPVNWFGDKEKEAKPEKPTPPPAAVVETPKPNSPPPAPLPVGPYNPPAAMPRYPYRNPSVAVSGNRAAAEPFYARGAAAQREGDHAKAIELYRQALQADPTYFEPRANLGLAAYQIKDYRQALYYLEESVAVNPTAVNARYNFALALQAANYPYDATLELKKLLQTSPGETRAHFLLATIYSQNLNSPAHAAEPFRKVLELEPSHLQAEQIRRWLASYAP